jgi:hypothetical protein
MKKIILFVLVAIGTVGVYASGVNEQAIVQETRALELTNRSDWLYKVNLEASTLAGSKDKIAKNANQYGVTSFMTTSEIESFDKAAIRYRTLLEIGVERNFITNAVKNEQMRKGAVVRDEVAAILAQYSGGLGLE